MGPLWVTFVASDIKKPPAGSLRGIRSERGVCYVKMLAARYALLLRLVAVPIAIKHDTMLVVDD